MLLLLITPSQWADFEQWCNYTLPAIFLILGSIFLFVGLIPFLCIRNKITWSLFGSLTTIVLIVGIFSYFKTQQAQPYFKETHYVTALTRSYSAQLFAKQPYDPGEIEQLKYVSDYETPSKLKSVYQRSAVKQTINYLGRDDYYVYVELAGKVMKFDVADCRKVSGQTAYFSGYHFKMRNKEFKKLGFFELPHYFRVKVCIPKSQWNKKVPAHYLQTYDRPGLVANWIPDSAK